MYLEGKQMLFHTERTHQIVNKIILGKVAC